MYSLLGHPPRGYILNSPQSDPKNKNEMINEKQRENEHFKVI